MTRGKDQIKFEDPPASITGAYDWASIATKLREQPNQWAKVFTGDLHSRTVSVRQGGVRAMRKEDGFEFRTTNNHFKEEAGKRVRYCDFYVRYVPPKAATKKRSN